MASLRDLGLSEYEARAYRSLLSTGATTAKELSRSSEVPMGRIYDVLNSLEQYSLVRSQAASRPKKYVAVEPETALDRLLDDKKRELAEKADQYEEVVEELVDELDVAQPVTGQFWTAAVGPEETVDLLVERLAAASDEIVMVSNAPSPQFDIGAVGDRVLVELEAALEREVVVSLLLHPTMVERLPPRIGDRYRRRLSGHATFEVRVTPDVTGTFTLVDGTEVCIQVPNPLASEDPLAMFDLKDPEFAGDVRSMFEPRWTGADPLSIEP
jgi:sugar-specific transcriptional regulator TrmB